MTTGPRSVLCEAMCPRRRNSDMGKGRKVNKTGRSEGGPRFIQLPYWLMETPAFLALKPNAKCVLLFMVKRFDGANNGRIAFGVRSGCYVPKAGTSELLNKPFGVPRSAIGRCLTELEAAGFIRCTREATFDQKRRTREWRLTWLECGNQAPTKDFAVQNLKASPSSGTMGANTVPPAGQRAPPNDANRSVQSLQRDYEAAA